MLIKLGVIFAVLYVGTCNTSHHEWELAVVINDQIELLNSNGTVVGSRTPEQFSKLKALTFDNVRHQFVVSDVDPFNNNDTIFSVELTNKTQPTAIVEDLTDDVLGLAIDPITYTLYWTDTKNRSINYANLNNSNYEHDILLKFQNENPHGIAIDICKRYIYWTNANSDSPTIERAKIDGTEREVLIKDDLFQPVGLAIDYHSQRLFWADRREGIYYRIESTNLQGKEREVVYEGTYGTPFGIAVDKNAIYWTDTDNKAIWKIAKLIKIPEKFMEFSNTPQGIIAKNIEIFKEPDCRNLAEVEKSYSQAPEVIENYEEPIPSVPTCLNGGQLTEQGCKCSRGFTGQNCEIALCHNYCLHGTCHVSFKGHLECRCRPGYQGQRCERDICDGYCLNGGECDHETDTPKCNCLEGYKGDRCEIGVPDSVCVEYCNNKRDGGATLDNLEYSCSCGSVGQNITAAGLLADPPCQEEGFIAKLADPWLMVMFIWTIISPFVFVIFVLYMFCRFNKTKPRIKKRIIVNKNVQPLTYRPQATEQCEITIENCCNMNVCETPCFEPRSFQKDDKKKLLSNMENGDY